MLHSAIYQEIFTSPAAVISTKPICLMKITHWLKLVEWQVCSFFSLETTRNFFYLIIPSIKECTECHFFELAEIVSSRTCMSTVKIECAFSVDSRDNLKRGLLYNMDLNISFVLYIQLPVLLFYFMENMEWQLVLYKFRMNKKAGMLMMWIRHIFSTHHHQNIIKTFRKNAIAPYNTYVYVCLFK